MLFTNLILADTKSLQYNKKSFPLKKFYLQVIFQQSFIKSVTLSNCQSPRNTVIPHNHMAKMSS